MITHHSEARASLMSALAGRDLMSPPGSTKPTSRAVRVESPVSPKTGVPYRGWRPRLIKAAA